jgi:glutaminyl-tRNA synthetase
MAIGKEVRLKYAYYVTCREVIKNEQGEITELICEYDPESRGGGTPDERKVKGTIQWVDSTTAINPEIRLYDRLFKVPNPEEVEEGKDYISNINPDSLTSLSNALVEASIKELEAGEPFQLERIGYFTIDSKAIESAKLVLNRSVAMRDSWAKKQGK